MREGGGGRRGVGGRRTCNVNIVGFGRAARADRSRMNVAALQLLQQQLAQSLVEHAALMLLTCLSGRLPFLFQSTR